MSGRLAQQFYAGTGLVFAGFGLAAVAVGFWFPGWPVEFDGTAEEWAAFYRDERMSVLVSVVLVTLGLIFLLWFSVVLHGVLKAAEEGPMRFSDMALGGAIFGIGAIHVAMLCFTAAAFRAEDTSPDLIMMMNDMAFICGVPAAAAGIAFFGAYAAAILRTGALPAWLGWLAAACAVLQAGPLGGAFIATGPFNLKDGLFGILLVFGPLAAWISLASIVMIRQVGSGPDAVERTQSSGL